MTSHLPADFLQKKLDQRQAVGALRRLPDIHGLKDYCSNDYLGLARRPCAIGSAAHGSTGSRLISGNSSQIEKVEASLAEFHEAEAALIFNSGYDANLGVCSSLPQRGDFVFYDELVHASIRDGLRLTYAKCFNFKHNDLVDLQTKAARVNGRVWVFIESLYSMDGDQAPLENLVALAREHGWYLVLDEAHALGVFGDKGEGLAQSKGLQDDFFARVYTFGKALGCHGALVACSDLVRQYLVNFARSFIYTTALPPASYETILKSYQMLPGLEAERQRLTQLINLFDRQAEALGLPLIAGGSQIKSLLIPGNQAAKAAASNLQNAGYDIRAILSPTVPEGQERLRICLHSYNEESELLELLQVISEFVRSC